MPVDFPEASSNSAATVQLKVKVFVGSGKPWGEASSGKQVEQQDPDNLIEAFKCVSAAP